MKRIYLYILISLISAFLVFAQDSTMTLVGPGVKYYKVFKPSIPWNITILEMDISNPNIKIKAELARDVLGTGFEKTSSMANRNNLSNHIVLGAINGDYFGISEPTNPYTFLSNSMIRGNEFTFGRSHIRSSFGFRSGDNKPVLNILNFSGTVTAANNSSRTIDLLNGVRDTNKLILYNKFIGATTLTNATGTEVKLQKIDEPAINSVLKFIATEKVSGIGSMSIGDNYILSGNGTASTFLTNNINVGDTVRLTIGTSPNVSSLTCLMGGGPRLITNGTRPSSFVGVEGFGDSHVNTRHPRTAVGFNADSTKVYFLVVDGRQPALSVGMSCAELADYMISIGCYQAVNLDGGGSSTMVVRNEIKNSPSDGSERSVGNALLAVAEIPTNQTIQSFQLLPRQILIDSTQTRKININATDLWGYPIVVDPTEFTWQILGINGMVDSLGFFIPYGTGTGKIIASISTLRDTIDVTVVSTIIPVWSFCAANGNIPGWFSETGSSERGLAYNQVNQHIYVVSRKSGNQVLILNANTGDQIGTLNTTGTSGGTFILNDVEVSDDGKIFAANLTVDASTSPFKIYMWNDESASAQNVISFSSPTAVRLGDKFTVAGSYADNSAVIYAAVGSSNKVFKWTMNAGSFNSVPTEITLSGVTNVGTSPAVYPKGLGAVNFYVNGNSIRPREFTSTGTFIGELSSAVIDSRSNAMRYIKSGQQEYLVVYQYGFPNENAKVLEVSAGLPNAVLLETTPSLGTNANTVGTSGDIAFRLYQQGVYIYYVLATNNGIAAYQLVNENEVPVELISFSAELSGLQIILNWTTATETNNHGFEIERCLTQSLSFNGSPSDKGKDLIQWEKIGFIPGAGNSSSTKSYSFVDNGIEIFGKYKYRLKQIDFDGTFEYSNEIEVQYSPTKFLLEQNYPNPFNPSTRIKYQVSSSTHVSLKVFDVLGNEIATLVDEYKPAGNYEVEFSIGDVRVSGIPHSGGQNPVTGIGCASGVYFYQLKAGDFISSKKMLIVK